MRLTILSLATLCGLAAAVHTTPASAAISLRPVAVAPATAVEHVDYFWHGARYPYRWRGGYYAYRWHGRYYRHRHFARGIWRYY